MGTMIEFFKHMELDMWETGENVCLFPVPQSFGVSYIPALTPLAVSLLEGTQQEPNFWRLCSYPLH